MFEQGPITHVAPISFEIRKNMTKATQGVSFHNLVFEDYQLALRSYKQEFVPIAMSYRMIHVEEL